VADDPDTRLRIVETTQAVMELRLSALEGWRRFDEPRIADLVHDDELAVRVRQALNEHSARDWKRWQKAGALLLGFAVVAGSLAQLVQLLVGLH
jgi:hypothetical protein